MGVCQTFGQCVRLEYGDDVDFLQWAGAILGEPKLVLFLLYCILVVLAMLLLSIYHTVVSLLNLTTNEHVKNYYYKVNPFDFGSLRNCRQVYCHPELVLAEGEDKIEA